jgi:hypothetical protein
VNGIAQRAKGIGQKSARSIGYSAKDITLLVYYSLFTGRVANDTAKGATKSAETAKTIVGMME